MLKKKPRLRALKGEGAKSLHQPIGAIAETGEIMAYPVNNVLHQEPWDSV
ncbi:hypothetical protein [Roseofilum capinflatum]|uniref:Uncharacterized protein n=1 Tax=Roseofilum capinflatum BLCC-M114 TaxID=3022440 RepID=A0ABT7B9L4_9CYAN|nr:hypothetical protein [Roseofilum capinflatum]MDJ1174968.1 hypothetical protein [Roseofilum capinflatum BLCC-M114]